MTYAQGAIALLIMLTLAGVVASLWHVYSGRARSFRRTGWWG